MRLRCMLRAPTVGTHHLSQDAKAGNPKDVRSGALCTSDRAVNRRICEGR
jgi:hypothetical protein